jgi:hypothetical protein
VRIQLKIPSPFKERVGVWLKLNKTPSPFKERVGVWLKKLYNNIL